MSTATSKWLIPFLQASDPVAQVDDVDASKASRLDLLFGEAGSFTLSGAANTTVAQIITFSRTYPGNNTLTPPGLIYINMNQLLGGATAVNWWVDTWTGSPTTITGCTFKCQFSAVFSGRIFHWRYLPIVP